MNISSISNYSSTLSASTSSAQPGSSPVSPQQKALLAAVRTVNSSGMLGDDNELTFKVDKAAGIAVVRIVNQKTGELVQQIPNEQVLLMAEKSNRG